MNGKGIFGFILAAFLIVGLVAVVGCKAQEPAAPDTTMEQPAEPPVAETPAEPVAETPAEPVTEDASTAVAPATEGGSTAAAPADAAPADAAPADAAPATEGGSTAPAAPPAQ